MSKNKTQKSYLDKVHVWGRISHITAICALIAFPLGVSLYLDAFPPIQGVIKGVLGLIIPYWLFAVVEVVTYTPMLGAGGAYLSFVTGNIPNLKLPCALSAMEAAKVKANSEEGEVISTIAIAISSIVTTVILAAGVLIFAPVLPRLTESELFKPAFAQVAPAIFGALGAGYFVKHWKISIFPMAVMILVLLVAPNIDAGTLLFPGIIASVLSTVAMYAMGWIGKAKN